MLETYDVRWFSSLTEISKADLVLLLESNTNIEFFGKIRIGSETRLYYRTTDGMAEKPTIYKLIYIVE